jgi:ABC-type nitrate/sulfonate/bicarbonate transport system permease component
LYPTIVVSQNIPIIALAPLFAIWFGFGMLPKIIVVVLVCFFPILMNLLDGFDAVDQELINLFRTMGANNFKIYRYVKLPASLPYFFSGLKIAITYSIMGAVIAEWLGGSSGLGIYMLRVKNQYNYNKVYAVTLIIIILCLVLYKSVSAFQNRFEPWKKVT